MRIGIAGIGRMGAAIGARLIKLGHDVHVWNRSPERAQSLVGKGARVATTAARLAEGCETVLTLLTDTAAIEAVYGGPEGLLSGDVRGRLFVEMSTVPSATERALEAKVRAAGAVLVECPVGGSAGPAREGKLLGLMGGADADVTRARPVLEQLCRRLEHVGPIGTGAAMKLAINLPLAIYWQVLGEALSLVQDTGLDPALAVDILADSSAGPNMLKPLGQDIVQALRNDPAVPVFFDIDSVRKDLRTMIEEGRTRGRPLPLVNRVLESFDQASAAGLGARNCTVLPAWWLNRGGVSEHD